MAGRRSTLTPELRERIEHELAEGVSVAVTAQRVGVSKRTLHSWLSAGKVTRRKEPDPLELDPLPRLAQPGREADYEELLAA